MPNICFFDLEVVPKENKIIEYGAVLNGQEYRGRDNESFTRLGESASLICGHNIINHDIKILREKGVFNEFCKKTAIDTLYLSVLLFPQKPYHKLIKNYQLDGDEINNPLEDAKLCRQLLEELKAAYIQLPKKVRAIYCTLLGNVEGFKGFFKTLPGNKLFSVENKDTLGAFIQSKFEGKICTSKPIQSYCEHFPIETAFALAIINVDDTQSLLPAWVSHQFPKTLEILNELRVNCSSRKGCPYCGKLSPTKGLKRYFGFDSFRRFEGDATIPLQQKVVEAGLANDSFIAVFPTGGGKSLTFQLPALMIGAANRSLTVIISPLQSLMKDQVDVLEERHDITDAVTINGQLSPLERGEAIERLMQGGANLLYISPESLRSKTIINILMRREINRFVIDEAHCFSSWGQDFRVDYLYIGRFLKKLRKDKNLKNSIPVSCFTATAKPSVIEDIAAYFKKHLNVELDVYKTSTNRENLSYQVIETKDKDDKYNQLKHYLRSEEGAKIIYVSRVKTSNELAEKLSRDGIEAKSYNGKMASDERIKIQEDFMSDEHELDTIVATTAFGMGVDKDNVKMVVHYNISSSLENYLQESGRAGRNPNIHAKCIVLYGKDDLNGHFRLLVASKLNLKEVKQIWSSIKKFRRKKFTKSALEIAKKAGWDDEMNDLETKVKVAISALEESGFVNRDENAPRIFASSILVKNVEEAQQRFDNYIHRYENDKELEQANRIFKSLISRARTKQDTRIDVMADSLSLSRDVVVEHINTFKEIGLISNDKDLSAYYATVKSKNNSRKIFERVRIVEQKIFSFLFEQTNNHAQTITLKEINEQLEENKDVENIRIIKDVFNYWKKAGLVEKSREDRSTDRYRIERKMSAEKFRNDINSRHSISDIFLKIIETEYLPSAIKDEESKSPRKLVEFSVLDLKTKTEAISNDKRPTKYYEYLLLFFNHLNILELKDGLLVLYNPMKITRKITGRDYLSEDYKKLETYYQHKTQQIHIVGEYAKKQLQNGVEAMQFVDDYFTLSYKEFIKKYFKNRKKDIKRTITEEKYKEIFSELSPEQISIVKSKKDNILVAAGPGSGKTRVLVHKVASLLLMEDIKPDQFLMLTFSRPAAMEFKSRIITLIGAIAYGIDIFTYHGFAFQLAGRVGDLGRAKSIITEITEAIEKEEIPLDKVIGKSVIVVDEYQDINEEQYKFLMAIINSSKSVRVIVAGDDDQNIYEFRGANLEYMRRFVSDRKAEEFFLTYNYRADSNLVKFTNLFLDQFDEGRMKVGQILEAKRKTNGFIQITKYQSTNMIVPLVEQIKQLPLKGTTAILTSNNKEASLAYSLLKENNIHASLITETQGFSLKDLQELDTFTKAVKEKQINAYGFIDNKDWKEEKKRIYHKYEHSINLDLSRNIFQTFESAHKRKYFSEWIIYLKEIKIEDFFSPEKHPILVSTMHKAKGKEFDNVFILLRDFRLSTEEKKRVVYVAMTRAKHNLYIHTNNIDFETSGIEDLELIGNSEKYAFPKKIILQAGLGDVNLGFFKKPQTIQNVHKIIAGSQLLPLSAGKTNYLKSNLNENATVDNCLVRFSNRFSQNVYSYSGYKIKSAIARHLVLWYCKDDNKEYIVVLPEIVVSP